MIEARPVQRVPRDVLRREGVTPVICPLPTTVALVSGALSGSDRGGLGGSLRAQLRRRDLAALLPLRVTDRPDGSGGRPNEIVPIMAGATIDEQLDAVLAVDPEELADGVEAATAAGHPTGAWRAAFGHDPNAWLRAYAAALRRAWDVIEPVWTRAAGLLDRDVERVGVAAARGAGAELVQRVFPFADVDGADVLLPSHSESSGRVRVDGPLRLVPLVAPVETSGWTDDYGDRALALRYAVPGAGGATEPLAPPESLAALLGPSRARILRWLDTPTTPGALADRLHGAPSMVTHHLRALEASGLVTRTRDGRRVRVDRTPRGTELLALYDPT